MKKRINVTIPEEVWLWASQYSKMNYTSLSALITSLLVEKQNHYVSGNNVLRPNGTSVKRKNVLRVNSDR